MKSLVFIAAIVLAVSPFAPSASSLSAAERPNIILVYADDISARELPIDGSSVWSKPDKGDTAGPAFRAKTPVLDQMAAEGCWVPAVMKVNLVTFHHRRPMS